MKTFHSVPPQSTSVQRTVCIWYYLWARYKLRQEVRASVLLLPRQVTTAKTSLFWAHKLRHLPLLSCQGHSALSPPTPVRSSQPRRSAQHPSARGRVTVCVNPQYLHISTSQQTVVQSFTLLHDPQSSIPKWQYTQLLSTRNPSHLLPRTARPAAPKNPFGCSEQTN